MASEDTRHPGEGVGPAGGGTVPRRGEVAVDAITALGTALSRPDGRVATLADRAGAGTLLVVVVDRRWAMCPDLLRVLQEAGARLVVISQGRPEAAGSLLARAGVDPSGGLEVLVEPAPHPVSDALAATGVPTFALIEHLELVAWQDGWDREVVASLVDRAGGRLTVTGALGERVGPSPSRLTLDERSRADLEDEDASLATYPT